MNLIKAFATTFFLFLITLNLFAQITKLSDGIGKDGEEVVIDSVRYVWRGGGLIVKNQKIIFLNSGTKGRNTLNQRKVNTNSAPFDRDSAINEVLKKFRHVKNLKIARSCECDNLILLEGDDLEKENINTDPGDSSDNNGTVNRSDGPTENSKNILPIIYKEENYEPVFPKNLCFPFEKKMAILDNGINVDRLKNQNKFFTMKDFGGSNNDIWGVNFTESSMNNNIKDFSSTNHGTDVANIITDIPNKFKIIPMKIIKGQNGNLFDAICAMLYAQKIGVDVINCSWGHNGNKNPVFENIVKLLSTENITIICSAGNEKLPYANCLTTTAKILSKRNTCHYPAMFANKGINLINVTNQETGNFGSKYTSCDINTVNSTYNSLISKYTSFSCAYVTSLFLHKFDNYKNDWSLTAINGRPKLLKKIFYNDATIFELTSTRTRVEKCRILKNVNTP